MATVPITIEQAPNTAPHALPTPHALRFEDDDNEVIQSSPTVQLEVLENDNNDHGRSDAMLETRRGDEEESSLLLHKVFKTSLVLHFYVFAFHRIKQIIVNGKQTPSGIVTIIILINY